MLRRTSHHLTLTLALAALILPLASVAQARPAARPDRPAAAEAKSKEGIVNINTASEEQLRLLPGIGPTKAQAIVKHRARHKFSNTWEITRVKGIGRKTYRRLRPHLTIKGPTTLTEKLKMRRAASE